MEGTQVALKATGAAAVYAHQREAGGVDGGERGGTLGRAAAGRARFPFVHRSGTTPPSGACRDALPGLPARFDQPPRLTGAKPCALLVQGAGPVGDRRITPGSQSPRRSGSRPDGAQACAKLLHAAGPAVNLQHHPALPRRLTGARAPASARAGGSCYGH